MGSSENMHSSGTLQFLYSPVYNVQKDFNVTSLTSKLNSLQFIFVCPVFGFGYIDLSLFCFAVPGDRYAPFRQVGSDLSLIEICYGI